MNVGTRVRTKIGDGRVYRVHVDENWTFGKPNRRAWVWVEHDAGGKQMYLAHQVEELDEIEWPE